MRPSIELGHLKYFYFTVIEGGVSPAADRLCVQQPVVSKMVGSLEKQLGHALFKKVGRRNTLTDYGQLVFRHCQTIFDEVDKVGKLEQKPEAIAGVFNMGASDVIAAEILPKVLTDFMEQFPRVNCNVYTATATQMLDMISSGDLDIGFFFHLPPLNQNLDIVAKVPTRFHLVIHPKKKSDPDVIQSFIGSREIDDLSNQKFPTVELLRKTYPKTRIVLSSNSLALHRQMVLQGKGVSILPKFLVAQDLKRKTLVDLYPKQEFVFDLKVVARRGSGSSATERLVAAAVMELQK